MKNILIYSIHISKTSRKRKKNLPDASLKFITCMNQVSAAWNQCLNKVPYFFGYKTGIFPAEMTPKNCTRLISKAVGSMPSFHQAQLVMDYMV